MNILHNIILIYTHFSLFRILASAKANAKKETVVQKSMESHEAEKTIIMEKSEAQEILNQALPALLEATEALNSLNKNDITEIKSFAVPPEPVQVVTECVAILLGYKEVNWKVSKQMMSDPRFLTTLKSLDADNITPRQQSQIRAKLKVLIIIFNYIFDTLKYYIIIY